MDLADDRYCFVCGERNPFGLKLSFRRSERGTALTEFTPSQEYQGYRGIVHGGIISTILDEIMIQAALDEGITAVTAELTVRFRRPLRIGETAQAEASLAKKGARLIEARSHMIETASGAVIAEATAKLLIPQTSPLNF
jgi:uncharacterized protein (TIGR00369 family)